MNQIRSIKEMLSIPTGSSVNRNAATSGYCSTTDSQFLFGSQFWGENSQGTSQDVSLSSRNSQQSSQEGSDPKFASTYHTKPLLFGDLKDKTRGLGFSDQFEEDKKKAKEKNDCDLLVKECQHIRETLNSIQQLVVGTERNTAVCQTVLQKFDQFSSTLQNKLTSLQSDISQQLEALANNLNSQKDVTTELEERVQKNGDTTAELGSHLQSLKNSLESLREEQERERHMLEEALKLLNTLVSEHSARPVTEGGVDSAIQTSPVPEPSVSDILQANQLEATHNLERNHVEVPPQGCSRVVGKKKNILRRYRMRRKRPLVLSRRSKCTVSDENTRPLVNCNKQLSVSVPLCEHRDVNTVASQGRLSPDGVVLRQRGHKSSEEAGCFINPLSCWSQDSSSSMCQAFEPILEKLSAESKTEMIVKPEGFWELFDMNFDSDLDV
ncbi:interactor of HORMAD1 protein 1 [Mugil cephalus]|uniref:interactor of HORMAD1 protein 1 n=1 Tax=Mugil cephalus TaxID=48193 RepID=UPI001FB76457|nr:interactor of HORMAD1 protein 1 [Mugil cephalus]